MSRSSSISMSIISKGTLCCCVVHVVVSTVCCTGSESREEGRKVIHDHL